MTSILRNPSPIKSSRQRQTTEHDVSVTTGSDRDRRHNEQRTMPHATASRWATHTSKVAPSLVQGVEFDRAIRNAVRQTRRSVSHLTPTKARILDDVARGRGITMVRHALDIARDDCRDDADATALPEVLRGYVMCGRSLDLCVVSAFRQEQESNGDFDLAQLEHLVAPSRATLEKAIETGNAQLVRTRIALDALYAEARR